MDHTNTNIVGNLNFNSIRTCLVESIIKTFDLFLIAELKLNSTFPMNQFRTCGYKMFRRDRNRFEGGLMLYINKNIPCRSLRDHSIFSDLELMVIEIHKNQLSLFFLGICKPPYESDNEFSKKLSLVIDHYLRKYENLNLLRKLIF